MNIIIMDCCYNIANDHEMTVARILNVCKSEMLAHDVLSMVRTWTALMVTVTHRQHLMHSNGRADILNGEN
jgi:hypothetical protein